MLQHILETGVVPQLKLLNTRAGSFHFKRKGSLEKEQFVYSTYL